MSGIAGENSRDQVNQSENPNPEIPKSTLLGEAGQWQYSFNPSNPEKDGVQGQPGLQ